MGFDLYYCTLKIWEFIWDSNSQNGSSLGSVRVHSLTLFYIPRNSRGDYCFPLGSQSCKPLPWSQAGFYRCGNPLRDVKMLNFPGLARNARNGVPGQMSKGRRPELRDKLRDKLAAFSRPIRVPRTILRHLLCCIREVQHEL
jgi:hypothetical protein